MKTLSCVHAFIYLVNNVYAAPLFCDFSFASLTFFYRLGGTRERKNTRRVCM